MYFLCKAASYSYFAQHADAHAAEPLLRRMAHYKLQQKMEENADAFKNTRNGYDSFGVRHQLRALGPEHVRFDHGRYTRCEWSRHPRRASNTHQSGARRHVPANNLQRATHLSLNPCPGATVHRNDSIARRPTTQ